MYQKTSEQQYLQAVKELGLKVRKDRADQQQIKFILIQILGYPNLQRAYEHHDANRLGTNDLLSKQHQIQAKVKQKNVADFQICNCCGFLLQNEELQYWTSLNQINLGIGVVLFFKDFLYYAFIFMLMFFMYSIYAMATNSISFDSDEKTRNFICSDTNGCGLSNIGAGSKVLVQNPSKNLMSQIQSWIGVAFVFIWGILHVVKSHFQQKQLVDIQTKRVSASDFTLMIEKMPKIHLGQSQQQCLKRIQDIFNQYYESERLKRKCQYTYEVVSVNIARSLYQQNRRNVQHKEKVMKQLHDRQDIFRQWIRQRRESQRFLFDYEAREKKYQQYSNYFSQIFEKQMFSKIQLEERNTIFVTMRHSKARQQIQENNAPISILKFWKYFKQSDFPIKQVKISKAPQPEQIKWQNIGFPSGHRTLRRILAWGATTVLILISLGISIGFSSIDQDKRTMQVSVSISIVITLVNLGIQLAIIYFSSLEYEYISSWQQSSMAMKIAVGQLVNSICVPIVVAFVSKKLSDNEKKSILRANGLADDVFFIALLNILVPISAVIDFYQILLKIIRWWKSDPDRRLEMYSQKQFNKYFGNYKFDIGYQYAFLIKTTIFTSFFVCMQPVIALFAPFALIFFYKATKRNLFRHFQRPGYHYATTNNSVDVILLFAMLFFGIGCLFVNNENEELEGNQNGTRIINIIIIIIACIFLIIVPFRIFYCCIPQPEINNKDYFQKRMLIYTDYDRTNPITKDSAISQFEHYIKNLEQEKGLPDEAQLVKLRSTIQNFQVHQYDNNNLKNSVRNSLLRMSRMSRLSFGLQPLAPLQKKKSTKMYAQINLSPQRQKQQQQGEKKKEEQQQQPVYNNNMEYFEQFTQQKSHFFGKPGSMSINISPKKEGTGQQKQQQSQINLFKITENSRPQADYSQSNLKKGSK